MTLNNSVVSASSEAPILNPETVASLQELGNDVFGELIDLFLQESLEKSKAMHLAMQTAHSGDLRMASHSLKGASLNMGLSMLANICLNIETKAKANDLNGIEALIEEMEKRRLQAEGELKRLRAAL